MTVQAQLVKQAKDGDKEAFASLYTQLQGELYRFALYSLGNPADAEDAVVEAFTQAYRGIGKLREPAAFHSWMFQILSAQCKRRIRGIIREKGNTSFEEMASQLMGDVRFEELSAERLTLLGALNSLKPQERMIVLLCVVYGYTERQVAQILREPQGTVSSKRYRALKKLRQRIEGRNAQ